LIWSLCEKRRAAVASYILLSPKDRDTNPCLIKEPSLQIILPHVVLINKNTKRPVTTLKYDKSSWIISEAKSHFQLSFLYSGYLSSYSVCYIVMCCVRLKYGSTNILLLILVMCGPSPNLIQLG
jgi:hypothetical protein